MVVVGLLLITPEMLWLMGGESYMEAKYVIPPVVVGCMCQFVFSLYINAEFYLKKQTRIAVGTVLAAALNIVLNIIFVPRYGYIAAAYTTLIGYLVLLVFHSVSLKLLKKSHWYDNKFNYAVVGLCMLMIPIVNWLYVHNTVRYTLMGVLACAVCIGCYVKRALLLKLVRH